MTKLLLPIVLLFVSLTCFGQPAPEQIKEWRQAAEEGSSLAQFNLGLVYKWGSGVPKDYAQAVMWYRKAALQGLAKAQCELGKMYQYGSGIPEDGAEAVKWYRRAAEQGLARGQYELGLMYALGQGVPEDYALAYMWLNLAAAQGDELAQTIKDNTSKKMTKEQIAEGQKLSSEWLAKRSK